MLDLQPQVRGRHPPRKDANIDSILEGVIIPALHVYNHYLLKDLVKVQK